jgi:hypothetical protein
MTRIALLIAALLAAPAQAGEPPDEATKIAALKLAYALNGYSMVGWGVMIDLSKIDVHREHAPPPDAVWPTLDDPRKKKKDREK